MPSRETNLSDKQHEYLALWRVEARGRAARDYARQQMEDVQQRMCEVLLSIGESVGYDHTRSTHGYHRVSA